MSPNPVAAAGLLAREVRSGSRDGTPTKIAIARRSYPTDQADLWDALTNAERIPRWFLPVSGDLKVGGRYQLEGNAGGTVERCDRPESFAVTWEFGGTTSWVRVTLLPDETGRAVDPATAVTFPASPEGAEFIREAAAGWADAAVRDGAEAGPAREAAARTAAFYTGQPEGEPGH